VEMKERNKKNKREDTVEWRRREGPSQALS
jgi:hypothetical protein